MAAAPASRSFEEGLYLLFDLGPFVGAIAVSSIERLFLASEVDASSVQAKDTAGSRRVKVAGQLYAGWALNGLLANGGDPSAWFVVRWGADATPTRAVVGVGACLAIRAIPDPTPLPGAVFASRPGAISGCFPTADLGGRIAERVVGLVLDVPRLWSKAELRAAERMLEAGGVTS